MPALIDTHCHLSSSRFTTDLDAVLERARAADIARVICIATSIADAHAVAAIAAKAPDFISASAGLDPFTCHEAGDAFVAHLGELEALLRGGGFVALGEVGLEYFHTLNPHAQQREQFEAQLDLAVRLDLPVVIHCRDAHVDMLATLRLSPRSRGVIHSFIGTTVEAAAYLELGWWLSFNGTVTYKANQFLRDAARMVPNDRLLIETDAPYLPPTPFRGQRNEPARVTHVLDLLADIRGQRRDDLAMWTTRNACRLFRLPAPHVDC